MLVFFDYARGSTILEGRRIYGYLEKQPPVDIPHYAWRANQSKLRHAAYNRERLEKIFKVPFEDIHFCYTDIFNLNWEQLKMLRKRLDYELSFGRDLYANQQALRKFLRERY